MSQATVAQRRARADALLGLWREYQDTPTPALRDRIILTLAPMVKFIVYRKVREMPAQAEAEDFISVGLEALIQSIDRYDPDKGATLEQYAWTRIHGAVLDEMRRQDWAPRSVRRWERDIEKAVEEFTALHGRRPDREELAEALGLARGAAQAPRGDRAVRRHVAQRARALRRRHDGRARRHDRRPRTSACDPEHAAATTEAKDRFRDAFAELPEREREIAVLLYVKNLTLAEIGEVLGVSESRICQIHGQTKKKLRTALADDAALFHLVA